MSGWAAAWTHADRLRDRARRLDDVARQLRREGYPHTAAAIEQRAVVLRMSAATAEAEAARGSVVETNCLACLEGRGRHSIDCPRRGDGEARRQETVDRLAGGRAPAWHDETGAVDVRLLCGAAGVAALAVVVWLAWPYLVGAGVAYGGWRVMMRGSTRRRRPRSSWSSLGRTAALMYAAWNSRWLKGTTARASIPARAGRDHVCGECGRGNDPVPF